MNADTCGLRLFVMLIDKSEVMVLVCRCQVSSPFSSFDMYVSGLGFYHKQMSNGV